MGVETHDKAKWYFDFISPFAYLQLQQFPKLPTNIKTNTNSMSFWRDFKTLGPAGTG